MFWERAENRSAVQALLKQLRTPIGVVPFVGAGLSIPYGFPSWRGFLEDLAIEAALERRIEELLNEGLYELAAQELEDRLGRFVFRHDPRRVRRVS